MHRNGNEGSLCRALAIGVPGGWGSDHVLQVAGWALLLQLVWRGREDATFPELIQLYYFLSGKPQIESSLLLWEFKRSTLRNSQTIFWDLFIFNHLISILGNFKPAYGLSPYLSDS